SVEKPERDGGSPHDLDVWRIGDAVDRWSRTDESRGDDPESACARILLQAIRQPPSKEHAGETADLRKDARFETGASNSKMESIREQCWHPGIDEEQAEVSDSYERHDTLKVRDPQHRSETGDQSGSRWGPRLFLGNRAVKK